ncbi:ornithine cyclodeaminase family protein [Phytoactinopolyspora mesophila]|uniref:Ornithine cyclodeaminase family protein n=1 Tax=Phytoactinopolyspora mesophila TaxID=2650750 RepID=A0A7K3M7L7_9ACTN|nr:NAD(P)-binding domain-containing protein [Phytoactinopolyspora mesophila]NDL59309.1 ornithine cyclodeaminase family protein [Phytoactinopolyspora mesophila]
MSRTLLLDHDETRQALTLDALLPAIRTALIATSRRETSTPPRVAAVAPAGFLGAMPGYVPGLGLAGKFVTIFPGVGPGGRSAHQGIVVLFDEARGHPLALMNGEAITAVRTAASATVAVETLVSPSIRRIAVIGAGTQARAQLEILDHLGLSTKVIVASRRPEPAAAVARLHTVESARTVSEAVSDADVIFCCTDATEPVIDYRWLRPGAHVSSVGGSRGWELDHSTVSQGTLFVEWPGAISAPPPAGAHELQDLPDEHATLIGSVLCGDEPAPAADVLTVYKSTGYAALDVAAAAAAYDVALQAGLGTWVEL